MRTLEQEKRDTHGFFTVEELPNKFLENHKNSVFSSRKQLLYQAEKHKNIYVNYIEVFIHISLLTLPRAPHCKIVVRKVTTTTLHHNMNHKNEREKQISRKQLKTKLLQGKCMLVIHVSCIVLKDFASHFLIGFHISMLVSTKYFEHE